uniref:Uncharacterized protein n=1 Tax=Anguilla anguilla TaxID=7936 RepID=A0A0E9WF50_ANGAN
MVNYRTGSTGNTVDGRVSFTYAIAQRRSARESFVSLHTQ